ncbi:MAG: hypothetical protein Kow0076_3770 [Francisella sp.]
MSVKKFTKKWFRKNLKELIVDTTIVFFVGGLVLSGLFFLYVSTIEIPDLSSFEQRRILQSTKIYDRTGKILLYDLHQDVKRTIVPYDEISHHIKNATVAIEDDTFFQHKGIRPLAILRAALTNLRGGDLFGGQGGSTITQQVIKNSILVQEKTITRKIKEAILALKLEQELTKEEILSHYLNESPYGGTIYGVEEASQAFFGKSAKDVDLAEAAYLAALPQAPTRYSPYGNNRELLDNRKNRVLDRMLELGFITADEYNQAIAEKVNFLPQSTTGIKAPHFVMYVREQLAKRYGEESLSERGFRVITTLDYDLQKEAERIVKEKALYNKEAFNAENAALIAINPKNGEILTMVGSRDYFDENIDGNFNIGLANRQPGSSFKPFVYATAFSKGYTPETILFDLQTQFSTTCRPDEFTSENGCYTPSNYDNKFRGPITMRNALAQSLNIPAVKTLYLAGISDTLKLARDAGISTLTDPDRYGLTLVLGGGEVKLLELTNAYGVFANEGKRNDTQSILRIEDRNGTLVEKFTSSSQQILDPQVALQISDILSDNIARTPLYGSNSLLYFGNRDVAAKTGTTNDYRDAWIVGYTPNLVVGAWAGNNDNRSMAKKISGLIITPMWREFMDIALPKIENESFKQPQPTPSNLKPILRGIWFNPENINNSDENNQTVDLNNTIAGAHSILHYVNKNDPRGPYPSNPASDSQYILWEYPVSVWRNQLLNVISSSTEQKQQIDKEENN